METMMNAAALARKLRTRLKQLKAERVKVMAKYERDFETWKRETARWLATEAASRVSKLKRSDFNSYSRCCSGLPEQIFKGSPDRPKLPDDPTKEIRSTLRFIAITGQQRITVTDRQLKAWFGGAEEEDEDEG